MNDDRVALLESSDDFDGGSEITPQLHFVIVHFVVGIEYADLGRSGTVSTRSLMSTIRRSTSSAGVPVYCQTTLTTGLPSS